MAASLGAAAVHTGITLWYRWPILMAAGTKRVSARDASELNRMVGEKVAAATSGLLGSQAEILRLATAAMTGKLSMSDVSEAPAAIAQAAMRPALRAVRANSRRLSRRA